MESVYPFAAVSPMPYESNFAHVMESAIFFQWAVEMSTGGHGGGDAWQADFAAGLRYIAERERLTKERADCGLKLCLICARFGLSGFESICLRLAASLELCEPVGASLYACTGSPYPTYWLAVFLSSLSSVPANGVFGAFHQKAPLTYLLKQVSEAGPSLSAGFYLRRDVAGYLTDALTVDSPYISMNICEPEQGPELYEDEKRKLAAYLAGHAEPRTRRLIILSAKRGSGRRALARRVCRELGCGAVFLEGAEGVESREREAIARRVGGLCLLTRSLPVVMISDGRQLVGELLSYFPEGVCAVFLCAEPGATYPDIQGFDPLLVKLPALTLAQRGRLWESHGFAADPALMGYRLSPRQIGDIAAAVREQKRFKTPNQDQGQEQDKALINREVGRRNAQTPLARIFTPSFGLADIVLGEKTKALLRQICRAMRYGPRLYEEWGYERLFPYGRGLGVLFHGGSGTGKTMAAQVIAHELGLDVMAADLSRVSEKYIGETEKHLSEIFEKAGENNCVLFFDEADALFAKRTEVGDSLDRHANAQTAHLLQKMEEYDGLVILATNLLSNVDDAFKRRLPFIVEFGRPDARLREELWRRFIPEEAPCADIDYACLAEDYDLTPAVMKWTAFSAGVRAYAEGETLSMRHILEALQYEYEKMGVPFVERDGGELVL